MNLVLVRNGIAEKTSEIKGISRRYDPFVINKLNEQHDSKWRLTKRGVQQAKAAGEWLKANFHDEFDVLMTGEYIRSLETAALLNIPNARWVKSLYLRTRDRGSVDRILHPCTAEEHGNPSKAERKRRMVEEEKKRDKFYWTPPGGESLAHLALRTERVLHWIRQHIHPSGSALIVTHKTVMESIRIDIERISQLNYTEKIENPQESMVLHYGSILQYTRRNPNTGEEVPKYRWVRVVTPWMPDKANPKWHALHTIHNGNSELLAEVSDVPHLF